MLSGIEIDKLVKKGLVEITDYDESRLNPNSYNLRLYNKLLIYDTDVIDLKKDNKIKEITIPEKGLLLYPNKLYLGRTIERTNTQYHIPKLDGRSSIGRAGIFVHVTAGFGDVGFNGYWTLELAVVEPVRIYPNIEICQLYLETVEGEFVPYNGKYQNNEAIQSTQIFKELQ